MAEIQNKTEKIKELKEKAAQLRRGINYYNALQLALKLVLNGSYGAFATPYFILYNNYVAGTITAEGRELTKKMDEDNEKYWYEYWHKDEGLHRKMHIRNVTKIDNSEPVSIYGDSVHKDSKIHTNNGVFTIEELYNKENSQSIREDKEVIPTDIKSLNWTEDRGFHYSKVKNIIKHKTSKKKWKIKANGKEVIMTDDHSIIVFRNNEKIEVKPSQIKNGDKVLIYK